MTHFRKGCSRSRGEAGWLARKDAIVPSTVIAVVPVRRTLSQKLAVSKAPTMATEPPRTSALKQGEVPPTWNSGSVTICRSSASR